MGVPTCINGDMNEDYTLNVIDVILIMEHILNITPYEPGNCTTDLNQDGILDILDVVLVVNIILDNGEYNCNADPNHDNVINVIDIVFILQEIN